MKFLVPGPAFEDSFAENVCTTLREMGHQVSRFEESWKKYYSLPRQLARLAQDQLWPTRPGPADLAILKTARELRPDVVLALTWDVHIEVLGELGKICPGRRVLWWGDPPANSRRWGLANPEWDVIYAKDPDVVPKLRLLGKRSELLHEAMNPRWHRPVATQANGELAIVGNYYGFRQALIQRLHRDGIALGVHGTPLPRWSLPQVRRLFTGRFVTREEKSRVFGEALGCLNTTSFAEGNSLNCRAFEIAGAAGLQLIEARPIIAACFEPQRELLTFATYEELVAHVDRARRFPKEMVAIREAGARRALAEHTYAHRLQRIVSDLTQ